VSAVIGEDDKSASQARLRPRRDCCHERQRRLVTDTIRRLSHGSFKATADRLARRVATGSEGPIAQRQGGTRINGH
jgi:hypothetical protein